MTNVYRWDHGFDRLISFVLKSNKNGGAKMENINEFVGYLAAGILPFLPVLFGAVEFIKAKADLSGISVELLSSGIFVVYGILLILAYFFPSWGFYVAGGFVFLLMCALAPSGFYKFVNSRAPKVNG